MATTASYQDKGLIQQGYNACSIQDLRNISNGLRFTPLVCMGLALFGLWWQNPYFHFAIAGLGIIPFWFPKGHPLDLLYNYGFRHLVGGVKLPANPLPRRIACVMGGLMNIGIGVSFYYGSLIGAYTFGVILIVLQTIVITTHFCVASYFYEGLMKMLGLWKAPLTQEEAERLLQDGALLIDVREPNEFQKDGIQGAINVPLASIPSDDFLMNNKVILYCQSGLRSSDAQTRLKKRGHKFAYSFGARSKWVS